MNRKLFGFCVTATLIAATAGLAQSTDVIPATEPAGVKFVANAGWYSDFVVDNAALAQPGPATQGDLTWNTGLLRGGLYLNLWASSGGLGETDCTVGWANEKFDINVAYFHEAGGFPDHIAQVAFKVTYPIEIGNHELKPYAMLNTISVLNSDGNSGMLLRVGLQDSWKLSEALALSQGAYLLKDSGIFRGQEGLVARYDVGFDRKHSGYILSPGLRFYLPVTVDDRDRRVVATFKVSRDWR